MDPKEALRWYEQQWEADRRRWEEEKKRLEQRLEEQTAAIIRLQAEAAQEREARERYHELAARPVLGAEFFHHLARSLELWDQALIEEAQQLKATSLEAWLRAAWKAREEALAEALMGGMPDWRRVRTGLVLEWALLAWLEGV